MSECIKVKQRCWGCFAQSAHSWWRVVNVSLNPELKDRLLSRELLRYTCPRCGRTGPIERELLYHDMHARYMVRYRPPEAASGHIQVAEDQASSLDSYRLRCVLTEDGLCEKIRLFDEGISDKLIEVLKAMAIYVKDKDAPEVYYVSREMTPGGDLLRFTEAARGSATDAPIEHTVMFSEYSARMRETFVLSGVSFLAEGSGWLTVDRNFALSVLTMAGYEMPHWERDIGGNGLFRRLSALSCRAMRYPFGLISTALKRPQSGAEDGLMVLRLLTRGLGINPEELAVELELATLSHEDGLRTRLLAICGELGIEPGDGDIEGLGTIGEALEYLRYRVSRETD